MPVTNAAHHRRARVALALLVGALPLVAPSAAGAQDKKACVDAYVKAQHLRQDTKLRAAREQLLICATDACPATLQRDCTQWSGEVETAIPTVVVDAKGPDGRDAVDVKVTMDGEPLLTKLDGSAVAVDPGVHTFRYQIEGVQPVEQKVVIKVAEKNRRLAVDFQAGKGAREAAPAPSSPSSSAPPAPGPDGARPIPPLVYVLGGVALVGAVGFTYFAVKTDSQVRDLDERRCKPNCPESDVDDAKTTQVLGYVAGGVGIAALGVAAVLFFTRPAKPMKQSALRPEVGPLPGGVLAGLRAAF